MPCCRIACAASWNDGIRPADLALASTPSVPVTLSPRYSAMRRPRRSSMITLCAAYFLARMMVCFSPRSSSRRTGNPDVASSTTGMTQSSDLKAGTTIRPPSAHSPMTDSATCTVPNNYGKRCNWPMRASAINGVLLEKTITARKSL
jgi:hypothetical protein